MPQYVAGVTATSNTTGGTQDLFLELTAHSSATIQVKRVRVGFGSGNQSTLPTASNFLVQLYRYTTTTAGSATSLSFGASTSTAGASSGSFWNAKSAVAINSTLATLKVKTGTTACVIGTGSVVLVDQISVYGLALWEFLARDNEDFIETGVNNCFCVALAAQAASQVFTVTVDWVE